MRIAIHIKSLGIAAGLMLAAALLPAQAGKIHGRLTEDGSTMPGTNVILKLDGAYLKGVVTGTDGKYEFGVLKEGDYTLEVKADSLIYRFPVTLSINETEPLNLELNKAFVYNEQGERVYKVGTTRIEEYIPGERREIFSLDPIGINVVPRGELENAPGRGVDAALAMGGPKIYQPDAGDALNMGGARDNGTAMYVDGCKVRGESEVSQALINQISFMNNGMPAEFGDATGGIIVISTYNPGMKSFPGKPTTRAERQLQKNKKKRGSVEGTIQGEGVHS